MKCLLVRLRLQDGSGGYNELRLCTAPYDVVLDSNAYTGSGDLLKIDSYDESNEITKTGLTVQLNGIDPIYQSEIANGGFVRAPIDVMICNVPDNTNVVDVYTYYHRGYCDSPVMEIDYDTGTLSIGVETTNIFTDVDRIPDLLRCSMATHASRHNGDKFFEFTADVDITEIWKD